jgi:hypothetical protein
MEKELKPRKLHCNRCNRATNHLPRGFYQSVEEDEHTGHSEVEDCYLFSCAGCEAPTLLVAYSASFLPEEEGMESIYPERNFKARRVKQFTKLPMELKQAYKETVTAYNANCPMLCAIGLRTLLEGVCDDKGAKGSNLEDKIDSLRAHLPTGNIIDYLHGFRFSGNEAAHELTRLSETELAQGIEVMEDLLNYLYDLDYKASRIKHASKRLPSPIAPTSSSKP